MLTSEAQYTTAIIHEMARLHDAALELGAVTVKPTLKVNERLVGGPCLISLAWAHDTLDGLGETPGKAIKNAFDNLAALKRRQLENTPTVCHGRPAMISEPA